ncbi:hypothetical protein [Aquirufa sp. TARAVU-A1A]
MKNLIQTGLIVVLLAALIYNLFFNESVILNEDIAKLNNKSWQISRAIDSLSNESGKVFKELFPEGKTPEEMVNILGKNAATDSAFNLKWIKIQTINNRIDSLEKVRFKLINEINRDIDDYSKLHPEDKFMLK